MPTSLVNHNVGALEITVEDASRVQMLEPPNDVGRVSIRMRNHVSHELTSKRTPMNQTFSEHQEETAQISSERPQYSHQPCIPGQSNVFQESEKQSQLFALTMKMLKWFSSRTAPKYEITLGCWVMLVNESIHPC